MPCKTCNDTGFETSSGHPTHSAPCPICDRFTAIGVKCVEEGHVKKESLHMIVAREVRLAVMEERAYWHSTAKDFGYDDLALLMAGEELDDVPARR